MNILSKNERCFFKPAAGKSFLVMGSRSTEKNPICVLETLITIFQRNCVSMFMIKHAVCKTFT